MAEYDYSNPFIGVATPETNYLRREVDIQKRYDPQGFWFGEAARAGSKLRRTLNSRGIAMGADDERAINNESMIGEIQKNLALEVEAGTMTPEEAQFAAVRQTMRAFMRNGDYESAASLKPALDAMEMQALERMKLRSEIDENAATTYKDLAAGTRTEERLPHEIDLLKAQAERARSGAGGKGSEFKINPSDQQKYINVFDGSASAIERMSQIKEIFYRNPAAISNSAAFVGTLQNELIGAGNTASNMLATMFNNEDREASLQVQKSRDADVAKFADDMAPSLNADVGEIKSLTMDLAYALAKARDPGGRLSDADVNNAMEIIGSAGDPKRLNRVLNRLVKNTYEDRQRNIRTNPWVGSSDAMAGAREEIEKAYKRYQSIGASQPGKGVGPAPAPAGAAAPVGEWSQPIQAPDGSTVRTRIITGE